ncbi:MAG TPA: FAD:protein FMN transferase [Bryobacteraceae bacterium]|jgi:thiamine biosynthesis lipoprotein|nr:FAD:protein FMN transferase [Bryobacteraceae bacterium]
MPVRTEVVMGTLVTIEVAGSGVAGLEPEAAMERAFGWFFEIEERCTRFDARSELMQLNARAGEPVEASPILFEAVRFALTVAAESGGAFDPAVGQSMESRGFNREHRTGEIVRSALAADPDVSYRDVQVDAEHRTITLKRPLTLDLGAVAKGLAVDTAARELEPFRDFAIDAGGDLYLGGRDPKGELWSVGIRHPRREGELIDRFRVSNQAVCTSGDYERGEHIIDPREHPRDVRKAGSGAASVTVIAPHAMLADALATAAFVMGPAEGIPFLTRMGVEGLIVTQDLERYETRGLRRAA